MRGNGSGFGLHGGALTAQSDGHGKGATFTLELPQQKELTLV